MEDKTKKISNLIITVVILLSLPLFIFIVGILPVEKFMVSFANLKYIAVYLLILSFIFYGLTFLLIKKFLIKDSFKMEKIIEVSKNFTYLGSLFCTIMINFTKLFNFTTTDSDTGGTSIEYKETIFNWSAWAMVIAFAAFSLTIYQLILKKNKPQST